MQASFMKRQMAMAAGLCLAASATLAVPVQISTPFINLENRNINSLGGMPGQFLRIGAVSVTPNGGAGTIGAGSHLLANGTTATRSMTFTPSPLNPNFFQGLFADSPELRGDWTLRFTNGADVASRVVNIAAAAQQARFVNSITLSGTSANPTFSWAPPPGETVNAYRINIYDKALRVGNNSGQVVNIDVLPSVTSHTVTAADFTVSGYAFTLNRNYSIEISVIQTKDGTSNSINSNLQAIARSYADFTPNTGGGPPVNLPVVLANGAFQFDMAVLAGQTYYIDPDVAVGYDYAVGSDNPNFASVVLPADIGDGRFDIYGFGNAGTPVLLAQNWLGGQVFTFAAGGISQFRVGGIETSAALDPANPTAFVTGLTFTGSGVFTGTQTPLVVTVVSEPASLWLTTVGLLGLAGWRRARQRLG